MSQKNFLLALLLLVFSIGVVTGQTQPADPAAAIERGNRSFMKADYHAALREYGSVPANAGETYAQALYNIGVSYELWRTAEATFLPVRHRSAARSLSAGIICSRRSTRRSGKGGRG